MEPFFVFLLLPVIVFAQVGFSFYRLSERHKRMVTLAEEFNGSFVKRAPFLREDKSYVLAEVDGRSIKYYPVRETSSNSSKQTLVVTTPINLSWSLSLAPSLVLLSKAQRALSRTSVTTGHPDFDDNYVLKSSDPARARVLFGSRADLRAPLLSAEFIQVEASGGSLRLTIDEQFSNLERERTMLAYAPLLATALENSGKLLEYEGTSGGLSIAEHDHVEGALSPATAPDGALTPTDDLPSDP